MTSRLPHSLVILGAGKMGSAMLDGWVALGVPPDRIVAIDPALNDDAREALAGQGISIAASSQDVRPPAVLVLAIKPQMLDAVAPALAGLIAPHTLTVSVLAGKTIADLQARCPSARAIVRAMPNTPASVGRGITAAVASAGVTPAQRDTADALLGAVGRVEWLEDEGLIDAVTAVSGSGPAYVFHMVEALAAAGEQAGLPAPLAMRLARATVEGSGELLYRSDQPPSVLRQNVTSPGGTTAAALGVLMAEETGLTALMTAAVAAAKKRAGELSG
ncbi:MAG: pyrroline-5-carboxylate reductase [Beijerinckiaceae bacterium]